jgi:enterochelin esterase-like enzyme
MRQIFLASIFHLTVLGIINPSYGQKGNILKDQILKSDTLKEEVLYNVYLPPNYKKTNTYPVIYYLHWFDANNNSSNFFLQHMDSLIDAKKFPEVIIITPNAKKTWYINDMAGKHSYSSMFIYEFLPYIKKHYSISREPAKTAVMGASMGGFGALRFAMLYPNEFGICISFMAGISTKEQIVQDSEADYQTYHQNLYGENLNGIARVNKHFLNNNPLYIAQNANPNDLKRTKWYFQACDNDYHSLPNAELHCVFHKMNIEHEFRITDGGHDGDCVSNSMGDALSFMNKMLREKR